MRLQNPTGQPKFFRTLGALLTHIKKEHPRVKVGVIFEEEVRIPKIIDDYWAEPAGVKMHIGNGTIVNARYRYFTSIRSDDESDDNLDEISESARTNDIDVFVESMIRANRKKFEIPFTCILFHIIKSH